MRLNQVIKDNRLNRIQNERAKEMEIKRLREEL